MPSQAWAQAPAGAPGGTAALVTSLFPFVLIFIVFYFLIIRPQKKRQQDHQKLLDSLKKGDRVLTSGGMFGTVVGVQKDRVVLKVADTVKIEFQKSSIATVLEEKGDTGGGDSGE
ncbi:MAG: preprotein translocase subunit YajC [bacterium]